MGGVEKNFFLITNYLAKKLNNNVSVITVNKEFTKKLNKKIKIISQKSNKWEKSTMYTKYTISLFLLIKTLISDRNYLIFSFQANWYAIIITKLFMSPIFKCLICRKDIERSTKTFWVKKGHLLCSTCLDNIDDSNKNK